MPPRKTAKPDAPVPATVPAPRSGARPLAPDRVDPRPPAPAGTPDAPTNQTRSPKAQIATAFYDIGALLKQVRDGELFRAKGLDTFEDYLAGEVDLSRTTAYKFIKIVETFPKALASRYGPEKLYAAVALIEATPDEESKTAISTLRVPVETDSGKIQKKTLAEASTREIQRAAAATRRGKPRKPDPGTAAAAAAAQSLVDRAAEALDRANLESVRLTLRPSRDGEGPLVRVDRVRPALAWRVFTVLAKVARDG